MNILWHTDVEDINIACESQEKLETRCNKTLKKRTSVRTDLVDHTELGTLLQRVKQKEGMESRTPGY